MTGNELRRLYRRLLSARGNISEEAFAALPVPGAWGHMAAISPAGRPSLLLRTDDAGPRPRRIALTGLTATFGVACAVAVDNTGIQEQRVSILECTAADDAMPVFAESAGAFLRLLGSRPTMTEAAASVARLAAIFSSLSRASRQSVVGLFGELMLLLLASDPAGAVACWRSSPGDRFDFNTLDARVECKASGSGLRLHSFTWEQCNPPDGLALVASMLVEGAGGGTSVRALLDRIEGRLSSSPDAAARLRETVAATMGRSLPQALDARFDEAACRASLRWFDLREIPAIRGELPPGVGSLRFTSDLSLVRPLAPGILLGTALGCLLPLA